ncbi:MAG: hypothetical protein KatS3mg111_2101 [Pirellulaceae bacterium]|nr:MAG: hypothetical protein KatS3mg111_2101 [Pirellulaceae bacterium]
MLLGEMGWDYQSLRDASFQRSANWNALFDPSTGQFDESFTVSGDDEVHLSGYEYHPTNTNLWKTPLEEALEELFPLDYLDTTGDPPSSTDPSSSDHSGDSSDGGDLDGYAGDYQDSSSGDYVATTFTDTPGESSGGDVNVPGESPQPRVVEDSQNVDHSPSSSTGFCSSDVTLTPRVMSFIIANPELYEQYVIRCGIHAARQLALVLESGWIVNNQENVWAWHNSKYDQASQTIWIEKDLSREDQAEQLHRLVSQIADNPALIDPIVADGILRAGSIETWDGKLTQLKNLISAKGWAYDLIFDTVTDAGLECVTAGGGILIVHFDDAIDIARALSKLDDVPSRAVDPKAVVNALSGFRSRKFFINGQNLLLDKAGMKHILQRHHPSFWDGTIKGTQSFFPRNMSITEIENAIAEVVKQNPRRIAEIGASGRGQIEGIVHGIRYRLGIDRGRIGQFYPIVE